MPLYGNYLIKQEDKTSHVCNLARQRDKIDDKNKETERNRKTMRQIETEN